MPSTADLAVIRQWVGPNVGRDGDLYDGDDIDERVGRLAVAAAGGTVTNGAELAALELLRTIHAGMLIDDPAIMSITGDYSESKVENLQQLERKIGQLERLAGGGTVSVTYLTRAGRSR